MEGMMSNNQSTPDFYKAVKEHLFTYENHPSRIKDIEQSVERLIVNMPGFFILNPSKLLTSMAKDKLIRLKKEHPLIASDLICLAVLHFNYKNEIDHSFWVFLQEEMLLMFNWAPVMLVAYHLAQQKSIENCQIEDALLTHLKNNENDDKCIYSLANLFASNIYTSDGKRVQDYPESLILYSRIINSTTSTSIMKLNSACRLIDVLSVYGNGQADFHLIVKAMHVLADATSSIKKDSHESEMSLELSVDILYYLHKCVEILISHGLLALKTSHSVHDLSGERFDIIRSQLSVLLNKSSTTLKQLKE